jgi:mannose-6-phosphate isomerase-like protein (cupin superfamily)
VKRSFEEPDARKWLAVAVCGSMGSTWVSHAPGWRWSEHSGLEMNAERYPDTHVGVLISGRLGVQLEDGSNFEVGMGEVIVIPAGHARKRARRPRPV